MDNPAPVIALKNVTRQFADGMGKQLTVLNNVSLALPRGRCTALTGASGAGKSTLLHMLGLLEAPSAGSIFLDGHNVTRKSADSKARLRLHNIGFVYQFHNLLGDFSALENVMMPLLLAGKNRRAAESRARELLAGLGLEQRMQHFPAMLSGGEQQRVAIARALVNEPPLLLADEPTGNLDSSTADTVFSLLLEQIRLRNMAALIATHDTALAARMPVRLHLAEGHLHETATGT